MTDKIRIRWNHACPYQDDAIVHEHMPEWKKCKCDLQKQEKLVYGLQDGMHMASAIVEKAWIEKKAWVKITGERRVGGRTCFYGLCRFCGVRSESKDLINGHEADCIVPFAKKFINKYSVWRPEGKSSGL